MKKFLWILIILSTFSLNAQEFHTNVPDMLKPDLADAYYKAGEGYINSGQKAKGEAYQKMAYRIFPEYDPENPVTGLVLLPEPELNMNDTTTNEEIEQRVRQKNLKVEGLVKYQFSKLIRSVVNEDARLLGTILGPVVYAPGFEEGMAYEDIMKAVPEMFGTQDLTSIPPNGIYDLSSVTVELGPGETYVIKVKTTGQVDQEFSKVFTFWAEEQMFFFAEENNTWKLIGAGYLPSL